MLNEFLTNTLQVIIVLDVVGVIAWFVLLSRRSPHKAIGHQVAHATAVAAPSQTVAAPSGTLWGRLTGAGRQMQPAPVQDKGGSMDDALGQLHRVLESYRCSLS